jgi:hypothetical protein
VGRLDVFARGGDGALWHKYHDGGWSEWESLGGSIAPGSGPAAVSWSFGRIDVFVRGTDNALKHRYYTGSWSAWESLGGVITSSPTVCSRGLNRLDVFAADILGEVWQKYYNGSSWSDWQRIGQQIAAGTGPAAISTAPNRIDLFHRGLGSDFVHQWWDGTWHSDALTYGFTMSGPGVASMSVNTIDVFMREGDGSLGRVEFRNGGSYGYLTGDRWPFAPSDPDAVSWGPNRMDVFVRGTDNALWHTWWDGTAWRP